MQIQRPSPEFRRNRSRNTRRDVLGLDVKKLRPVVNEQVSVPVARVRVCCSLVFGKELFTDCSLSCDEVVRGR